MKMFSVLGELRPLLNLTIMWFRGKILKAVDPMSEELT